MKTSRLLGFAFSASLLLGTVAGCGSHVISGGGSSNNNSNSSNDNSTSPLSQDGSCGGPTDPNTPGTAVLVKNGDLSGSSTSGGTTSSTSTGGPAPSGFQLVVSNTPVTCADPNAVATGGNQTTVYVSLTPDQLVPGQIQLDLHNANIFQWTGDASGNGGGGGGSVDTGLLTITIVDGTMVRGHLTASAPTFSTVDADFDAARCDAP